MLDKNELRRRVIYHLDKYRDNYQQIIGDYEENGYSTLEDYIKLNYDRLYYYSDRSGIIGEFFDEIDSYGDLLIHFNKDEGMLDKDELRRRVLYYLDRFNSCYQDAIGDYELDGFCTIEEFIRLYYQACYDNPMADENVMFQMFSAIGAFDDENNPYVTVRKDISKKYGLDRNILEVCSGIYPSLSKKIDEVQQRDGKGTITSYDTCLVDCNGVGKINLCKDNFRNIDDYSKYSLIISRMPPCCEIPKIIKNAIENNIEFYIVVFNGDIEVPENFKLNRESKTGTMINSSYHDRCDLFYEYLESIVKEHLSDDFEYIHEKIYEPLTNSYNDVIRTKKKVKK